MKNKKGDLSLSVNAIVIMVIAFVVLGLALTFTKIIFKGGTEQLERAIGVPKFEQEATSSNPITIGDKVNLGVGKESELTFQYYNKQSSSATNVVMEILDCKSSKDGTAVSGAALPTLISSIATSVGPSEVFEFKTVLNANEIQAGLYICTIAAVDSVTTTDIYESKTFFLNVVS